MSQCPKCMHSAKSVLDDVEIACKRIVHDAPERADCSVTNDMWRRWKGENREEGKLIAQLEGTAEPEAPAAEPEVEEGKAAPSEQPSESEAPSQTDEKAEQPEE